MPERILLAKPGLDVHDRGIRVLARACRDAGMEVVYLGVGHHDVDKIAKVANEEDVDVVGLSIMSGRATTLCKKMLAALDAQGASDIPLVAGGVIRVEEIPELEQIGVKAVFRAGASLESVLDQLRTLAQGDN